jgi:hypothetical protein
MDACAGVYSRRMLTKACWQSHVTAIEALAHMHACSLLMPSLFSCIDRFAAGMRSICKPMHACHIWAPMCWAASHEALMQIAHMKSNLLRQNPPHFLYQTQTDCMVVVPAPVVRLPDSHVYAYGPRLRVATHNTVLAECFGNEQKSTKKRRKGK